jgi:hypothetical protein
MNGLGLAAPNRIRCQRAAVARPCGGSLRLRGLVVDNKVCVGCGTEFGPTQRDTQARWVPRRYCSHVCYRQRDPDPPVDRFWGSVAKVTGCWLWQAGTTSNGYGKFRLSHRGRTVRAHRYAYELLVGPIPDGLQLDHLCRNRVCVNPAHLEPVTARENVLRGNSQSVVTIRAGVCVHGHPRTPENLYIFPNGKTRCRTCHRTERHRR